MIGRALTDETGFVDCFRRRLSGRWLPHSPRGLTRPGLPGSDSPLAGSSRTGFRRMSQPDANRTDSANSTSAYQAQTSTIRSSDNLHSRHKTRHRFLHTLESSLGADASSHAGWLERVTSTPSRRVLTLHRPRGDLVHRGPLERTGSMLSPQQGLNIAMEVGGQAKRNMIQYAAPS